MARTAVLILIVAPLMLLTSTLLAQQAPYDVFPAADPPYYRVRYEALTQAGELPYAVNYTLWVPPGVKMLRGVIVHQHGCGEGSCKSGLTGAYDLHWQALAKKHDCALLAPAYEQPEKADCQLWCDPRNGSDAAFQKCLVDFGAKSGHPEMPKLPWALWGHSGGGHWAGGMVLLHPERVAAAWLRSGVPLLEPDPKRTNVKAHSLPAAALQVPVMCNPGTKEGVTVKEGRFAGVWPANEAFFLAVRSPGGLIGVAVDPLSSHECGNQRYFAIPWLDACLRLRLPPASGAPLNPMPTDDVWLAALPGTEAVPAAQFKGDRKAAIWLPNESIAKAWMKYVKDTDVPDETPPPAPRNLRLQNHVLTWEAEADLESGLAGFQIERDGRLLAKLPEQAKNPFGRPLFQNLQYSDTPTQPLVAMQYTDTKPEPGKKHAYRVIAINTVGVKSEPSKEVVALLATVAGRNRLEWRTKLSDGNEFVRLQAVNALGQFQEVPVDDLVVALADRSASVRYWALHSLRRVPNEPNSKASQTVVEQLTNGLRDEAATVRIEAALGVALRDDPKNGLAVLEKELRHPVDGVRIQAINAIEELGDFAKPLQELLRSSQDDDSEYVKRIAGRILSRWK